MEPPTEQRPSPPSAPLVMAAFLAYVLLALAHTGHGALAFLLVGAVLSIAPDFTGLVVAAIALVACAVAVVCALGDRERA